MWYCSSKTFNTSMRKVSITNQTHRHIAGRTECACQRSSTVSGIVITHRVIHQAGRHAVRGTNDVLFAWHNVRFHFIVRQLHSSASHQTKTDRKTIGEIYISESVCVSEWVSVLPAGLRMTVRKNREHYISTHLKSRRDILKRWRCGERWNRVCALADDGDGPSMETTDDDNNNQSGAACRRKKKREKFYSNTENWFNNLGKVFDHKIGSGGNRI